MITMHARSRQTDRQTDEHRDNSATIHSAIGWVLVWLSVPVQSIMPGKTRLRNDQLGLYIEWDVKPNTLTHSITHAPSQATIKAVDG